MPLCSAPYLAVFPRIMCRHLIRCITATKWSGAVAVIMGSLINPTLERLRQVRHLVVKLDVLMRYGLWLGLKQPKSTYHHLHKQV